MNAVLIHGDARRLPLADKSVSACITSPPYWNLRAYFGIPEGIGIGMEPTPQAWVASLMEVFTEVWRVLRNDGCCFINCGDAYTSGNRQGHGTRTGYKQETSRGTPKDAWRAPQPEGLREKNLLGLPWRLAFALQDRGWILRSAITLCKVNPMPESVTDRPSSATEMLFMLVKQPRYYYDQEAVREPMACTDRVLREAARGMNAEFNFKRDASRHDRTGGMTHAQVGARMTLVERGGRNLRNWWLFTSEPFSGAVIAPELGIDHYATMPTALAERCIRASTSAHGVCAACGAPWRRVVEREFVGDRGKVVPTYEEHGVLNRRMHPGSHYAAARATTGWTRTCRCATEERRPAIVLDPFCGSGSTGLAAMRLGRHAVLVDASLPYLRLARARLGLRDLAAWNGHSMGRVTTYADLPLFAGE